MTERQYTTIDKSDWGAGLWLQEPDKVQWRDEATGLPCLAKRSDSSGAWCGYVGVPTGHPYYEKGYNEELLLDIEVHGGLTYADRCEHGPEETSICHVPEPGEPDDVWWLGFDCAHSWDLSPAMAAREQRLHEETGLAIWGERDRGEVYRSLAYVRAQVAGLARQIGAVREQVS